MTATTYEILGAVHDPQSIGVELAQKVKNQSDVDYKKGYFWRIVSDRKF